MASDLHPKYRVITATLLLAAATLADSAMYPARGALTACAFAAAWAAVRLWRALNELVPTAQVLPLEIAVGVPRAQAELTARLLALETQLEFAPIALFRLDQPDATAQRATAPTLGAVAPLNANARRLMAPGRASDPACLFARLGEVAAGQREMIDFETERGTERALAIAASMTLEGKPQRLLALMPVENELEAEAMQAWQKLVHVLTHEIMNSLTPVASLSHTARDLLTGLRDRLPPDVADDLDVALDAIGRRARSLTHFVGNYRTLASVPAAQPQQLDIADLFARLSVLAGPAWQARGGRIEFVVEPASLALRIDGGQFEQALLNLLGNAAEATAGVAAPVLAVSARLSRGGRLRIEVRDNGPGVPDDLIAHIFTPFFSTKDKGGGIGLAMVRQLVHRNGGTVRYAKSVGNGARFIIAF